MIFILLILNIILGLALYKKVQQLHSREAQYRKDYLARHSAELNAKLKVISEELAQQEKDLDDRRAQIKELRESQEALIKTQKEKIDIELNAYQNERKQKLQQAFDNDRSEYERKIYMAQVETEAEIAKLHTTLSEIKEDVNDWQKKRDAINEEILRSRAMEEQQDFYRICLPQESFEDIEVFNAIRTKLHNHQILDKVLYDNYVAKPTKEMIKRVLKGRDVCGIYKVTNIQTKECYIGKSNHIGTRWTGHIKSACGLDGVADSMFQRALKKYGIDQFTFEVIEEVPKENLTEREKYYITLYDTTKFGYNMKVG